MAGLTRGTMDATIAIPVAILLVVLGVFFSPLIMSVPFQEGNKKVRPIRETHRKSESLIVATQSQSSRKGRMSKERKHFLPKYFSLAT